MSNKYYQKHKEKPWKEALERYQNLSEKKTKTKTKKKQKQQQQQQKAKKVLRKIPKSE